MTYKHQHKWPESRTDRQPSDINHQWGSWWGQSWGTGQLSLWGAQREASVRGSSPGWAAARVPNLWTPARAQSLSHRPCCLSEGKKRNMLLTISFRCFSFNKSQLYWRFVLSSCTQTLPSWQRNPKITDSASHFHIYSERLKHIVSGRYGNGTKSVSKWGYACTR